MRWPVQGLLGALLVSVALSGCFSGDDATQGLSTGDEALVPYSQDFFPVDLDHDHADPTQHTAAHNVEFVAYHSCQPEAAFNAAATPGFTDIKEWGDYVFVGEGDGFCILDVSDPWNPQFVSHFEAEKSYDIDVSDDGQWVFHGMQRNPVANLEPAMNKETHEDLPRGLIVADVTDKSAPAFESFYPVPTNGVHTVHYYKHSNGDDIVLVQTYDWLPPGELGLPAEPPGGSVNGPGTQRVEITRLVQTAGSAQLERVAMFSLPKPAGQPFAEVFPHDCTAQLHPATGQDLIYCAYWNAGMVIVDITDPTEPQFVSQYDDPAPSRYNQYHYVLPVDDPIDGRHITVAAPELPVGVGESGYVRVFDTTDPARPEQIGAWTLPGVDGFSGGFLFSPHQFDVYDGKIVIGHNHGGVWVIDISDAQRLREPESAAFYFPHGDESLGPDAWPQHSSVWVAVEHQGFLFSVDTVSGLHIHRYLGDA